MDKEAMVEVAPVTGITLLKPPIFSSFLVPVEYSTAPEFKKRSDLKEA
ncbi:unnamed protein product [marine sediment metagenome]|uniref:Uncharacterized protein n=1 Tax=marine sediment metagenome TaxID=412755 RepID=X1RY61_9ZZZZ